LSVGALDLTWGSVTGLVAANLSRHTPVAAGAARAASVSVILFEEEDECRYVLIRRARRGRNAGQWALPGGKVEPDETALEGALREAREEVALDDRACRILGVLDDFTTMTGFVITPFVVAAPIGWRPVADAEEVRSVHSFSIERLHGPEVVHWAEQPDGTTLLQMRLDDQVRVHAPTGAILLQFRELGLFGRHTAVADLTQPTFTHR
jgi:8-oxo-dGTP pyrophosphatase MutT (NUDIX family)